MKIKQTGILLSVLSGFAAPAFGAEMYVAGGVGSFDQDTSTNNGSFVADFTTGAVTGVTPPLTVPAGSPVGWSTTFDNDTAYSLAVGWKLPRVRVELEYAMADSDITSHRGVNAAGIDLTGIDAGVLLSGNVGDLGVTVGDLVADGRGRLESNSVFVNAIYDFRKGEKFSPYLGLGLGYTEVDVRFSPSGVGVIDDSDSGFAYQFILGASYALSPSFDLFGSLRIREADDARVQSPLLSASFEVENSGSLFDLGIRYNF
jgi:opacity protein-like surface antigen